MLCITNKTVFGKIQKDPFYTQNWKNPKNAFLKEERVVKSIFPFSLTPPPPKCTCSDSVFKGAEYSEGPCQTSRELSVMGT